MMTKDQSTFMSNDDSAEQEMINAAVDFLKRKGYRIQPPIIVDSKVITKKDLINHFYRRLDSKYPNRRSHTVPNYALDMQMISKLIQARMDSGLGERAAIQECVRIINAIFDNEKDFNFKYPIRDTRILGQAKLGWVTAKALSILETRQREVESEEIKKRREAVEFSRHRTDDEVEKDLDALLKSMEENN